MITANKAIQHALSLPSGARFYKCALQVNPFEYVVRHSKPTASRDEDAYNTALVKACVEEGIEIIGVTDHHSIRSAQKLILRAQQAGLIVFPGFETATKEGVHLLCLLEPGSPIDLVQAKISDCGIHDETQLGQLGKYDVESFLDECEGWGTACIAAHVAADDGLLKVLKGRARIAGWSNQKLTACSLPGPISDAPQELRSILENKDPQYKRPFPVAVLNAQDVSDPADVRKPGSSCWIKMSEVSVQGLRQAFLDSSSRVRLASDPPPEAHSEFVAIGWEAGFLDGTGIHFNPNLNVLIGGRGAGKSTVVESLRYLLQLEPIGEESRKNSQGIVSQVLKSGTKISLLVRSHTPNQREYLIERTVPNPPVVRDESGQVLSLTPKDVLPRVEIFGQHEISELARDPAKRTRLLDRFMTADSTFQKRRLDAKRGLDLSRRRIADLNIEIRQIQDRLATLPVVEETLKRYQESGLEERLKEQSLIVKEERVFRTASERLAPFKEIADQLRQNLPIDRAFLSERALEGLPAQNTLRGLDPILLEFENALAAIGKDIARVISLAETKLADGRTAWNVRKDQVEETYQKILRELQKSKIDADEFLRLRRQIEDLRPLKERLEVIGREIEGVVKDRRNLLAEWEELQRQDFERLRRAAKKVNRQLDSRVSVEVRYGGNREPLLSLLKEQVGGRLAETLDALKLKEDLSLSDLTDAIRLGKEDLARRYSLPPSQADRLVQAGEVVAMQVEELELPPVTQVRLNISTELQNPDWKTLDELSTGQKATAVLLLLLLESDAPLIVDQPEDDLDNRFISEGVVPKMREEKRRRQFVFATHNANIPVLGDAELIVGLTPAGEAGAGSAEIRNEHLGSIDSMKVRELVEELLEGGRDAFEMRRRKYGF